MSDDRVNIEVNGMPLSVPKGKMVVLGLITSLLD